MYQTPSVIELWFQNKVTEIMVNKLSNLKYKQNKCLRYTFPSKDFSSAPICMKIWILRVISQSKEKVVNYLRRNRRFFLWYIQQSLWKATEKSIHNFNVLYIILWNILMNILVWDKTFITPRPAACLTIEDCLLLDRLA